MGYLLKVTHNSRVQAAGKRQLGGAEEASIFFLVSVLCVCVCGGEFRDWTHACGDEVNRETV